MTTERLTWGRTKDALVVGIGAALVALLGFLLKGQSEASATLAEVKRDIAIIATESKRDREEVSDLKARVRDLETRVVR